MAFVHAKSAIVCQPYVKVRFLSLTYVGISQGKQTFLQGDTLTFSLLLFLHSGPESEIYLLFNLLKIIQLKYDRACNTESLKCQVNFFLYL